MMERLYPLVFTPIFKSKIWGGQKIRTVLGKDFSPLPNCGETWELSGVNGNVSVVTDGDLAGKDLNELIEAYGPDLLGRQVYERFGKEFPLLVKFIDANDDLSIQVHPGDEVARERHGSFGKTEMWYILQADEGATLISGFNQPLDRATFQEVFESGRLLEVLNREEVQAGDVFFLPAGRVHTIGKGLLLAEIQQTSDVTYRIYDFDRRDDQGNLRELHIEQALDAIDYRYYEQYKTAYQPKFNESVQVADCPYFEVKRLNLTHPFRVDVDDLDSFVILVITEGDGTLWYDGGQRPLAKGQVVLLPAGLGDIAIEPHGAIDLLEAYIPAE